VPRLLSPPKMSPRRTLLNMYGLFSPKKGTEPKKIKVVKI